MKKKSYEVFRNREGVWIATFAPKIAKVIGSFANKAVQAPSEATATRIADILAKDSLRQLRELRQQILNRVSNNPSRRQTTAG